VSLCYVRLGCVGSTVGKVCFVVDFVLHTAWAVDACSRTCILPSLSLIDILYGGHKSDAGVGSGRWRRFLDWDVSNYSCVYFNR
jgi:hypothetical protein